MEARSTPSRTSWSASRFLSFTHVTAHTNSLLIFLAQHCSFARVSQTQAPLAVEGYLGSFHFGAATSQVATSNCRQAFLGTCVFLSLGEHHRGEILGHVLMANWFPQRLYHLCSHRQHIRVPFASHPHQRVTLSILPVCPCSGCMTHSITAFVYVP